MDRVKNDPDFNLKAYDYELPPELIAERPVPGRQGSRLLVCNASSHSHQHFVDLPELLPAGSTLVLNRSKVFPCRLLGHKLSGGEAEMFILSLKAREGLYQVLLKASGKRKVGEVFVFHQLKFTLQELGVEGTFWIKPHLLESAFLQFLERHADIPIPPYIRDGKSDEQDKSDYQTIYAQESGSVAAPTAGLHFTEEIFERLKAKGITIAYVTLHVGLGTFRPVKSEDIRQHKMHAEAFTIAPEDVAKIQAATEIYAVGTTSLRALECCQRDGSYPQAGEWRETDIFLYPGQEIKSIQGLITNFHLPQSSLIMLVSTLLGRQRTLALYQEAIRERYRFFSYGDAMLIRRKHV